VFSIHKPIYIYDMWSVGYKQHVNVLYLSPWSVMIIAIVIGYIGNDRYLMLYYTINDFINQEEVIITEANGRGDYHFLGW
jgi:hypothetical protein